MATDKCPYCSGVVERTDKVCGHCHKSLTGRALQGDPPSGRTLSKDTLSAAPLRATGVSTGAVLLLVAAIGVAALGGLSLSNATSGVGLLCGGCLLAIWARIAQASVHHQETIDAMSRQAPAPSAPALS